MFRKYRNILTNKLHLKFKIILHMCGILIFNSIYSRQMLIWYKGNFSGNFKISHNCQQSGIVEAW
jgi:hypothetical protein